MIVTPSTMSNTLTNGSFKSHHRSKEIVVYVCVRVFTSVRVWADSFVLLMAFKKADCEIQ